MERCATVRKQRDGERTGVGEKRDDGENPAALPTSTSAPAPPPLELQLSLYGDHGDGFLGSIRARSSIAESTLKYIIITTPITACQLRLLWDSINKLQHHLLDRAISASSKSHKMTYTPPFAQRRHPASSRPQKPPQYINSHLPYPKPIIKHIIFQNGSRSSHVWACVNTASFWTSVVRIPSGFVVRMNIFVTSPSPFALLCAFSPPMGCCREAFPAVVVSLTIYIQLERLCALLFWGGGQKGDAKPSLVLWIPASSFLIQDSGPSPT